MSLTKRTIPAVSREFALELQKRFRPIDVRPGFDRDELMQSVGEQRVINFILAHANHHERHAYTVPDNTVVDVEVEKVDTKEIVFQKETPNWFSRFTNRFGN